MYLILYIDLILYVYLRLYLFMHGFNPICIYLSLYMDLNQYKYINIYAPCTDFLLFIIFWCIVNLD